MGLECVSELFPSWLGVQNKPDCRFHASTDEPVPLACLLFCRRQRVAKGSESYDVKLCMCIQHRSSRKLPGPAITPDQRSLSRPEESPSLPLGVAAEVPSVPGDLRSF